MLVGEGLLDPSAAVTDVVPELAGTVVRRRDRAAPARHAGRHALRRGLRQPGRRRPDLRADLPVAAGRRRAAAAGRDSPTTRRWATTASTAARSATGRSSPTCSAGWLERAARPRLHELIAAAGVAADGRRVRCRDHRRRARQRDGGRRRVCDAARPRPLRRAVPAGAARRRDGWRDDTARGAPDGADSVRHRRQSASWPPTRTTATAGGCATRPRRSSSRPASTGRTSTSSRPTIWWSRSSRPGRHR